MMMRYYNYCTLYSITKVFSSYGYISGPIQELLIREKEKEILTNNNTKTLAPVSRRET